MGDLLNVRADYGAPDGFYLAGNRRTGLYSAHHTLLFGKRDAYAGAFVRLTCNLSHRHRWVLGRTPSQWVGKG